MKCVFLKSGFEGQVAEFSLLILLMALKKFKMNNEELKMKNTIFLKRFFLRPG